MTDQNQAEIISIGTELLMGETVDTNASYLASELQLLGIELIRITVVGDDRAQLCHVLSQAMERADIVLTSGGLGPTQDDLTRECLADALGEELVVDRELEKELRAFFHRQGRQMAAHNVKQVTLIPSAKPITNRYGTAPGWWVEKNGKIIVTLPGPPRELKPMWQNEVQPRLRSRFRGKAVLTRTIKVYGLPEARVAEMVEPVFDLSNPSLGIYAKSDGIHLRLIARGGGSDELIATAERQLEELLRGYIWGKDDDELPDIIGKLLIARGLTLATMEDGTRGKIAGIFTSVTGSSGYYRGGLIAYPDEVKIDWGVSAGLVTQYGAISAEIAEAMAVIAREKFSADIGLGITGIAGLDGSVEKTPGLAYIGVADNHGKTSWEQGNLPYHDIARERAAVAALFRLRQRLIEIEGATH